jgi:CspA family cold shock protein
MALGIVKWFSNARGYGFIAPDGEDEDVFAHFSVIDMNGYKTLKSGQRVEFDVAETTKGLQATSIRLVMESGDPGAQ